MGIFPITHGRRTGSWTPSTPSRLPGYDAPLEKNYESPKSVGRRQGECILRSASTFNSRDMYELGMGGMYKNSPQSFD